MARMLLWIGGHQCYQLYQLSSMQLYIFGNWTVTAQIPDPGSGSVTPSLEIVAMEQDEQQTNSPAED